MSNPLPEIVPLNLTPYEISILHSALNTAVDHWRAHLGQSPSLQSRINEANAVKDKLIAVRESIIEPVDDDAKKQ